MPSVKLLVARAGVTPEGLPFSQSVGRVIDVSDAEAKRMIEAGQAEAIKTRGRPKTAAKPTEDVEKR